ncbi:MAG TPA: glycosyltransferase [Bacteroidales bacterium]|jgi:N-acetylglucosaminyldiphosphoundecaprenol N-acetyl-beta-D-mannosaminyltransferase|nr:glycosyltransferase [Bacteroidales bacterium]
MVLKKTPFYNLLVNNINTRECLAACNAFYLSDTINTISFINAHCFNIAQKNQEYLSALNHSSLLLNDGVGIDIAASFARMKFKENMNGTDLIPKIIKHAYESGKSIYLMGGVPGIIEQTKTALEKKYPGIKISGTQNGYFKKEDNPAVLENINNSGAELLIVGMGVPRQELWIHEHKTAFKNIKIAVAGGAIVDFIAGKVKRAPLWMQKLKIEWLFRFINEPKRLFKRYFIGNMVFFMHLISYKLRKSKNA